MDLQHDAIGMMTRPPIAICCGDPAGVGPEVIEKALRSGNISCDDFVLIGPHAWASHLAEAVGCAFQPVGAKDYQAQLGQGDAASSRVALQAMQLAAQGCQTGQYRGVVTGPVSKYGLSQVGFRHAGQTEFFAHAWGGVPTMAFVGAQLRVVLATWHIPLSQVSQALTTACLERAVRRAASLVQQLGTAQPRIAVCGLNPHAGENGLMGDEERLVMDPCLDQLRAEFPGLSSCLPGDTACMLQRQGQYDVVVAAYHDQGLAAVKTLEFDQAVNVSLGLPFIRTSPDHGTAFGIAGQNQARPDSLLAALRLAHKLTLPALNASEV